MTLGYCKVCELDDFDALASDLRALFPAQAAASEDWPHGAEHRKHWEIAQVMRGILDHTPKRRRKRVLGVGAGSEPTIFLLTESFDEVHATDLYAGGGWRNVAPDTMLTHPEHYSGGVGDVSKLTVQHMDARDLRYADESVDAVFCTSSIEHFGDWPDMMQAAREMGRVLKPGGVAVIVTEYDLNGTAGAFNHNGYAFNEAMLHEVIVAPSGCALVQPLNLEVSQVTRKTAQTLGEAISRDMTGRPPKYPHILLEGAGYLFTSVSLVLQKPE